MVLSAVLNLVPRSQSVRECRNVSGRSGYEIRPCLSVITRKHNVKKLFSAVHRAPRLCQRPPKTLKRNPYLLPLGKQF